MYKFLSERCKRKEVDIENRNVFHPLVVETASGQCAGVHEKSWSAQPNFYWSLNHC